MSTTMADWVIFSPNADGVCYGGPGRALTYHLEVKSTSGPLKKPFCLSNDQMDWA
jgi:hypothetical protein